MEKLTKVLSTKIEYFLKFYLDFTADFAEVEHKINFEQNFAQFFKRNISIIALQFSEFFGKHEKV